MEEEGGKIGPSSYWSSLLPPHMLFAQNHLFFTLLTTFLYVLHPLYFHLQTLSSKIFHFAIPPKYQKLFYRVETLKWENLKLRSKN